jgi:hypothetical protein
MATPRRLICVMAGVTANSYILKTRLTGLLREAFRARRALQATPRAAKGDPRQTHSMAEGRAPFKRATTARG